MGVFLWARYPCEWQLELRLALSYSNTYRVRVLLPILNNVYPPSNSPESGPRKPIFGKHTYGYRGTSLIRNTHPPRITLGP